VWTLYSVGMAALQTLLTRAGMFVDDRLATTAGALVLLAAGAYQFAPLKSACLTHCRNPLTYFLARWEDGPVSGVRLGLAHGWYCLGCCWALMLTALALGAMNLWWMAALTVVVAAEQIAPAGVWLGRLVGAGLIVWALWLLRS
jgi:predicted metal-binding membrane protein